MNECKKCESLFDKALYGELSFKEKEFFEEHLNLCVECSVKYSELSDTLNVVKMYERPEPDEKFMEDFWETLEPEIEVKLKTDDKWGDSFIANIRSALKWKYQLAAGLAILLLGILIGKYFFNGNQISNKNIFDGNNKTEIPAYSVKVQAAKYLERSKILLLGITNFDPATDDIETISLPHIQKISRDLLNQTPALKAELSKPSQKQLKKLVNDLQIILLQIANLEAKNDITGIELIKDGVNSSGIFLKINIQELQASGKNRSI